LTEFLAYPKFLWFLVYGLLIALALIRWIPKKRKNLTAILIENSNLRDELASSPKYDWRSRKALLYCIALTIILFALLGPQWGVKQQEIPSYGGNLVFVLDISDSMLAQDIKPSRIERAKLEITETFLKNRELKSRFALVTFAGRAYMQCPLTLDPNAVKFMLEMVAPGSLPYPGTNIAAGLKTAGLILAKTAGAKNVLLITDGEDHEGNAQDQAKELAARGIVVSALWVGSPAGEPIPMRDENGGFLGYKKDKNGQTVVSRAQGTTVESITKVTGGQFIRLEEGMDAGPALRKIIDDMQDQQKKGTRIQLENRFQIPLAIGFLLMLTEFLLPDRKKV